MFLIVPLFGDDEALDLIIAATDAKTAKALGRKVKDFEADRWDANCREIVTRGNLAKFQQNAAMRDFLIGTGGKVLVEASPSDRIWGIGLRESDKHAKDPLEWRGTNLLGFALMDVREEVGRDA